MKKLIFLLPFALLMMGIFFACQKESTNPIAQSLTPQDGVVGERVATKIKISGGAGLFICGIQPTATTVDCDMCATGNSGQGEFITSNAAAYTVGVSTVITQFSLRNGSGVPVSVTLNGNCPAGNLTVTIPANSNVVFDIIVGPGGCQQFVVNSIC